ncbi:hypothetical protein ACLHDG_05100 [Sulfurovum sp. CS9]|uniref:hypothetical protein n=1 Tax=Sulfurovum sp. CS9 TaxID=3391146 RepID=UPI0039ECA4F1
MMRQRIKPFLLLIKLFFLFLISISQSTATNPKSTSTGLNNTTGEKLQNIKLFDKITLKDSVKVNPFAGLKINTNQWWSVPYKMSYSKNISYQEKKPGMKIYLAGTQDGKKGWGIDNFLFIEIFLKNREVKQFVVGSVEPTEYRGKKVNHLGGNKHNFGPKEIELGQYIPDGSRFALTITPLDYGSKKFLTDVWLIYEYPSPTAAEGSTSQDIHSAEKLSPDQQEVIELLGAPNLFRITYLPLGEGEKYLARYETWSYPEYSQEITFIAGDLLSNRSIPLVEGSKSEAIKYSGLRPELINFEMNLSQVSKIIGSSHFQRVEEMIIEGAKKDGVEIYQGENVLFYLQDGYLLYFETFGTEDSK